MRLLIQPASGVQPIITAIEGAKKSVEIVIFRLDRTEIEEALAGAVSRGVFVHALIAHTAGSGEQRLRQLEGRLLRAGITVAQTAGELRRYHNKMMIIDRRAVFVLAFNFTTIDMIRSRSFGVISTDRRVVDEAVKLFEADTKRQMFEPSKSDLVVSPANARERLADFIQGAKRELLIYDLRISDGVMVRLLEQRAKAGVEVKVIGQMSRKTQGIQVQRMAGLRLHARTIVRDSKAAFVGSQSLRANELDTRREVGIIFRDSRLVKRLASIFEEDWSFAENASRPDAQPASAKVAKKIAKAISEEIPPVGPVIAEVLEKVPGSMNGIAIDHEEIEESVRVAVKQAVRDVMKSRGAR